jgi:hypothetical protein
MPPKVPSALRYAGKPYSWNHARKSAEEAGWQAERVAVLRIQRRHIRGWAGSELRNDIKTLLISKITGILEEQLSSIVRPWTASSKNLFASPADGNHAFAILGY